ncbi:MAG: hypothetical protein V4850_02835 [Myxococcota bacterium]
MAPDAWIRLTRWVRFYSCALLFFVTSTLVGAHLYPATGQSWTTCKAGGVGPVSPWCIAVVHLYEGPLVLLAAYTAYVGLARFAPARVPAYTCLVAFQLVTLFGFATYETPALLHALSSGTPTREIAMQGFAVVGMIGGTFLGFYTVFGRLLPAVFARAEGARVG